MMRMAVYLAALRPMEPGSLNSYGSKEMQLVSIDSELEKAVLRKQAGMLFW